MRGDKSVGPRDKLRTQLQTIGLSSPEPSRLSPQAFEGASRRGSHATHQGSQSLSPHSIIDYDDGRNEGLISDRLVETSKGYEIHQIIYVNPADGVEYRYLTNEKTLPAWVIVLLYNHRRDIEKVFDETKTKLEEQRSWACSKEAKMSHALFLRLTHNLMLLLEEHLRSNEGMKDTAEPKKKLIRERTKKQGTGFRKNLPASYNNNFFPRASQWTFRFIRWLRDGLLKRLRHHESLTELADAWKCDCP